MLEFLERYGGIHGSEVVNVTDDILGLRTTASMGDFAAGRKMLEFPLVFSDAADPQTEGASCRDLAHMVDEALAGGRFCNVGCEPALTPGEAAERLGSLAGGELAPKDDEASTDSGGGPAPVIEVRHLALFNYRVVFRHLQDEVLHPAFVFDVNTRVDATAALSLLVPGHPWESRPEGLLPGLVERLDLVHDAALVRLRGEAAHRLRAISAWLNEQDQAREQTMDTYFDELARELEEERRSIYYHLYFFEKEQEIEDKMRRIEDERRRRQSPRVPVVEPQCSIELVNVGVFQVPFARAAHHGRSFAIDLLEGRVAMQGERYVTLD